jgi:hypothetical protein
VSPVQGAEDKWPALSRPGVPTSAEPHSGPVVRQDLLRAETRPSDSPEPGSVAPSRAPEMINGLAACAG